VNNATKVHIIAYQALLSDFESAKVAEEKSFIIDEKAILVLYLSRKFWTVAGGKIRPDIINIIPAWPHFELGFMHGIDLQYLYIWKERYKLIEKA